MEWDTMPVRESTPGRYTRTAADKASHPRSPSLNGNMKTHNPITCNPIRDTWKQKEKTTALTKPNQQPRQQQQQQQVRNTFIMLFSLFIPTLLILLSASATPLPLRLDPSSSEDHQSLRRAPSFSTPPAAHFPSQPYHSDDLAAAPGRKSLLPPYSSGTIETHRSPKRFIMDADYAASSSSPAFRGKSSRKRGDSLSDLTGSTTVGYKNFQGEFPPKLPSRSSSA